MNCRHATVSPLYQPHQISAQEAQPGQISKYHRGGNRDILVQVGLPSSPVHLTQHPFQRQPVLVECISGLPSGRSLIGFGHWEVLAGVWKEGRKGHQGLSSLPSPYSEFMYLILAVQNRIQEMENK